eukprot:TRINITY_DN594_c0_g1_i2.p1 TRINITY_DN594_c0_g1~~TRINITY_DN594_c0_g1_i2.p1  ORF type:complete len:204 (-),score=51.92 TRINITY_DN594_c0_g1_i2:208-819(-)
MGNAQAQMENQLLELKMTSKQLNRLAGKLDGEVKLELRKVKQSIEQGNVEGQRLYAQNAIRKKNERMNYLRLASRIDAVASRLQTAVKMNMVTGTMSGIVKSMGSALESMNMERVSKVMDQFEKQFEDLDVQSSYIETAMDMSTSTTTPVEEVDSLIGQVADEHGLELEHRLDSAGKVPLGTAAAAAKEEDELTARLAQLKNL